MTENGFMLLLTGWLVWFTLLTPGAFLLIVYNKFYKKLSTGKAVIEGFKGWFIVLAILLAITIPQIIKHHPSFN